MTSFTGKRAVVVGGSSGVGKATVKALISNGARVTAVARGLERLQALKTECGEALSIIAADACDPHVAERVLGEIRPELLVLSVGHEPNMAALPDFEWAAFSHTWNTDGQAAFHFTKYALRLPLPPGSTIVTVSSGVAIDGGSPMSGGYAAAKRMQWMLAGHAQKFSDSKNLGIRAVAVLPNQLIEGSRIGAKAASVYSAAMGLSVEAFMERFGAPLDSEMVATAVLGALSGEVPPEVSAVAVRGSGLEYLK